MIHLTDLKNKPARQSVNSVIRCTKKNRNCTTNGMNLLSAWMTRKNGLMIRMNLQKIRSIRNIQKISKIRLDTKNSTSFPDSCFLVQEYLFHYFSDQNLRLRSKAFRSTGRMKCFRLLHDSMDSA